MGDNRRDGSAEVVIDLRVGLGGGGYFHGTEDGEARFSEATNEQKQGETYAVLPAFWFMNVFETARSRWPLRSARVRFTGVGCLQ